MRIGIVCPYSWDVPGGAQQHVRDLSEALIQLGHQVSVIAPCDETSRLPAHVVAVGGSVPVPYNGSVARLSFGPRSANRVRLWLREGKFDVLHVHEPAAPSLSLLAAWIAEEPIVATFHAAFPRSRALNAASPILRSALEKISIKIAVSESARSTVLSHVGGDCVLIANGVSVSHYAQAGVLPGRSARQLDGAGRTIGFLGRMNESRKGLSVLLEAFPAIVRSSPQTQLLIAGPGNAKEVLAEVSPDVRSQVEILGELNEDDKARYFHSIDVFCAPNTGGESFGIIVTEAMSAGAPILASDIQPFRDVLAEGKAGMLYRNREPADLADKALKLLADPAARRRYSRAAQSAVQEYDWSNIAMEILEVYSMVAKEPRP